MTYVLLEVDEHGEPTGDEVFGSVDDGLAAKDELNESADGDPVYGLFEVRAVNA